MNYEPEIGQALFGQPHREFAASNLLDAALRSISRELFLLIEVPHNAIITRHLAILAISSNVLNLKLKPILGMKKMCSLTISNGRMLRSAGTNIWVGACQLIRN